VTQATAQTRTVLIALWAVALVCLGSWASGHLHLWRAQQQLAARSPQLKVAALHRPSRRPTPTPQPQLAPGDPVGTIAIRRIGLHSPIVSGVSDRELDVAVGHFPATSLPGQDGNVALAGHRDTVFRPLRRVENGDTVTVITPGGVETVYEVAWSGVVEPEDVWVLEATASDQLTLVTCYPFSHIGPAPRRFVVRARPTR
jgi:sortase A